jgi:hypothetical protein
MSTVGKIAVARNTIHIAYVLRGYQYPPYQ